MNEAEKKILEYLENSYVGARAMDDDESCQARLAINMGSLYQIVSQV